MQRILEESIELDDAWPYGSVPYTLLGNSCMALLDDEEAQCLRKFISVPLSQSSVVKQAPRFAEMAQKCLKDIASGKFEKKERSFHGRVHPADEIASNQDDRNDDDSQLEQGGHKVLKVNLGSLRSYTFDLINGPVFDLNMNARATLLSQSSGAVEGLNSAEDSVNDKSVTAGNAADNALASPPMFMLWIRQLKEGLCGLKITLGPTCMQLWRLNSYGRALHARGQLEKILRAHVEAKAELVPVQHETGRVTIDPLTAAIPLVRRHHSC